jgi:lysozyme family protein
MMKRIVAAVAAATAALAFTAPAFAHFCFKEGWNERAAAGAGKSQAWMTPTEMNAWVQSAPFICPAGKAVAATYLSSVPSTTLFLERGLLAGGTLKNEKGNTPEHFGYLLDLIEQVDAACAA